MAREYKDLVVGLDIGTAKVMVVVAEIMPGGELKLAGLGVAPSNGIKRGVVVTAAHCIADFGKKQFYTNWRFVPGYRNGTAPFGAATAKPSRSAMARMPSPARVC